MPLTNEQRLNDLCDLTASLQQRHDKCLASHSGAVETLSARILALESSRPALDADTINNIEAALAQVSRACCNHTDSTHQLLSVRLLRLLTALDTLATSFAAFRETAASIQTTLLDDIPPDKTR